MSATPWQIAEVPGPSKALVIKKPEVIKAMLKKSKRPILVVGHQAAEISLDQGKLIDYSIDLSKTADIPIVATAHIIGEFIKRGFQPDTWMPVMDIANRLSDATWEGLDGKGTYDLSLFLGVPYNMMWVILSGLKHFSQHLTTITLDPYYQPHASWSFPNLKSKDWQKYLEELLIKLGGK